MKHIPKVRNWKVRELETNKIVIISTINKRLARWVATTVFSFYGTKVVSLCKSNV